MEIPSEFRNNVFAPQEIQQENHEIIPSQEIHEIISPINVRNINYTLVRRIRMGVVLGLMLVFFPTIEPIIPVPSRTRRRESNTDARIAQRPRIQTQREIWLENVFHSNQSLIDAVITAPPQVGKTTESIDTMMYALQLNWLCLLTTANALKQLGQITRRITQDHADIIIIDTATTNWESVANLCILRHQKFILVTLYNNKRVDDIIKFIKESDFNNYQGFLMINDEGDTTIKHKEQHEILSSQPKVHQAGIELVTSLSLSRLVRISVTATPENNYRFYGIQPKCILILPQHQDYTGFSSNNFEFSELSNDIYEQLHQLEQEYFEIQQGRSEAILWCMERMTGSQDTELRSIGDLLENAIVHTYNSKTMKIYIPESSRLLDILKDLKIQILQKDGTQKEESCNFKTTTNPRIYTLRKETSIRDFYTCCKDANVQGVITIGYDLIDRGISFVSGHASNQLCATRMFYNPGKTLDAVSQLQAIGRTFGNVRPDLMRRVITSPENQDSITNLVLNQQEILLKLQDDIQNDMTTTQSLWETYSGHSLKHNVTRVIGSPNYGNGRPQNEQESDSRNTIEGKIRHWYSSDRTSTGYILCEYLYQQDFKDIIDIVSHMRNNIERYNEDTPFDRIKNSVINNYSTNSRNQQIIMSNPNRQNSYGLIEWVRNLITEIKSQE